MIERVACKRCGRRTPIEIPEGLTDQHFREVFLRAAAECGDCRAQREVVERELEEARLNRRNAHRTDLRIKRSKLPKALEGVVWDDLQVDDDNRGSIAAARKWTAGAGEGLVLTGGIGVGKTTIAAAAAWGVLTSGRSLQWTFIPTLFARIFDREDSESRRAANEVLLGRGALVLDDLDKAKPTQFGAETILEAIDFRIAAGDSLLVTMNLDYAALASRWPHPQGDAIASRLIGHCGDAFLVKGRDRRLPVAAEVVPLPGIGEAA